MGYTHLASEERYYICQAVKSGTSLRAIAKAIGRSVSTVSRELARNTGARGYRYSAGFFAHRFAVTCCNAAY